MTIPGGAATSPAHALRLAVRAGWLVLAPLLLSWVAMRLLIPGRGEVESVPGAALWSWLARLGDRHPLPLAVGFFLLGSALLRVFSDRLPGGRHLAPTALPLPGAAAIPPSPARPWHRTALAWASIILVAGASALALRTLVGQPYRVSSASMLPTLEPGDYVLVSRLASGTGRPPRRGDLVVFPGHAVGETGEERVIKRVVGIPGDRITVGGGLVQVNGWQVPYCDAGRYIYMGQGQAVVGRLAVEFLDDQSYLTFHTPEGRPSQSFLVEPGQLFVLGDNRNASRDSRSWQQGRAGVPLSAIEGQAWRIVGFDRQGHLDANRLLLRPGVAVHLPGMDAREVEARIARCLARRPAVTSPPNVSSL